MTTRNFLIESTAYTGRRFQQRRPSAQLAKMNPNLRWCAVCVQSVTKYQWAAHLQSHKHRDNTRKELNLQNFAVELWERHRGAPIDEESIIEKKIRHGIVAEVAARQNERSDAFSSRMLQVERSRAKSLGLLDGGQQRHHEISVEEEEEEDDRDQTSSRSSSLISSERSMLMGGHQSEQYRSSRLGSRNNIDQEREAGSAGAPKNLVNHAAMKREMLLSGVADDISDSSHQPRPRSPTSRIISDRDHRPQRRQH